MHGSRHFQSCKRTCLKVLGDFNTFNNEEFYSLHFISCDSNNIYLLHNGLWFVAVDIAAVCDVEKARL